MRLYDGGRVPNSRRVRIFLAEKGVTIPLAPLDLGRNEHKTPQYSAVNPLHRVPALELDDGRVLTESIAICRLFEGLHPNPRLFGTTLDEQVFIEMWQRRLEFELFLPVAHAFRHLHPAMAGYEVPQVPDWGKANMERAVAYMRQLDSDLGDRPFICGETISVADITGLVALDFTRSIRLAIPDDLANLRRWHAALSARQSARA